MFEKFLSETTFLEKLSPVAILKFEINSAILEKQNLKKKKQTEIRIPTASTDLNLVCYQLQVTEIIFGTMYHHSTVRG